MTRRPMMAVLLALPPLLFAGLESPARACSPIPAGIYGRTVWPGDGAQTPTNVRLVVSYSLAWTDGRIPAIGSDLVLLDADGSTVAITTEVTGSDVVVRPDAPLLPNHGYQLADRRTVPCTLDVGAGGADCQLTAAPSPIASFTTGATSDVAAPTFAGLSGFNVGDRENCATAGSCCSVYDVRRLDLVWAAATDDVGGADVRYNVYSRRAGKSVRTLIASRVSGTVLNGAAVCSGDWYGTPLPAGAYLVRAVDWAGNEDANTTEVQIGDVCGGNGGFGCSVGSPTPPTTGRTGAFSAVGILLLLGLLVQRSRRG